MDIEEKNYACTKSMVSASLRTSCFDKKKKEINTVRNDPIWKRNIRQQEMPLVGVILK